MRDLYVVALVLLAGLAGTVMQAPPSPKDANKGAAELGAKTKDMPQGPLTVVCDVSKASDCNKRHIRRELFPNGTPQPSVDVNVIVAFVPDPERTNLRLFFDRALESLQNAAQDEGYRFLDYWLPWSTSPPPEYELRDDREAEKDLRRATAAFPGALVFQGPAGEPGLVIFLVGDRPSAGYSKDQWKNALDYEAILHPKDAPLKISGPNFSGSLGLLAQSLGAMMPKRRIVVHSGTASSARPLNKLKNQLAELENESIADSYFACDDEMRHWLIGFLENHLDARRPFSMLHESRTVFGTDFARAYRGGFCIDDPNGGTPEQGKDATAFINYSFPPGLSYVRKAYGKTLSSPANADSPGVPADRLSLQLDLSASEQGQDQQPEFSGSTPVSHDAELAAAAEALQHDRIHYAGVVATDPLDTLFVASYLRSAIPDTRLVFLDADVLDALPGNDISLEGSLLVSSYPVFFEAQGWYKESRPQSRSIFSSQFEEGTYNATRALFDKPGFEKTIEPTRLWVSVIGRDGLWPVSVQQDFSTGAKEQQPLGWSWPPRVWVALASAMVFALGTFFTAFLLGQNEQPPQWCADYSLYPSRGNLAGRGAYITGTCVSLIGCWLAATGGQIGLFLEVPNSYWFGGKTVLAVGAAFLAFGVWLSVWTIREFFPAPGPRLAATQSGSAFLGYLSLPWFVFSFYAVALGMTMFPSPNKEGYFFALRSIELGSGVSPSLPFLFICIAFVLFCTTQLKRVVFTDERFQRVPSIETGGLKGVLSPRLKELDNLLAAPLLDQPWNVAIACFVAPAGALWFSLYSLQSIEGKWFDWAYAVFVAAVCLGLVLTVSRFWFTWRLLRRVLEVLELHPMRDAFSSIPKDAWSSVWRQSSGKRSYQLFARTLESLREMKDQLAFACVDFDRIEKLSNELILSVSSGVRERIQVYWNLQHELYVAGCAATASLSHLPEGEDQIKKFVAMRYASLFRYVMSHLRNLATFLTFGYVLLALSLGSYPFLAPRGIAWFLSVVLVGLSVPVVSVFHEMSADPILRRMTVVEEGKTDWSFITRTASFTALPVLSVMASHFPFVGKYVLSWVQPALKSIH